MMIWLVAVPAAWFGIALALGLLIGRCIRVEVGEESAAQVLEAQPAAATAPTTPGEATSPVEAGRSAVSREESLVRT